MTNEQIKKALECCCGYEASCDNCPNAKNKGYGCRDKLLANAHNLVIKQEKEIERLKEETGDIHKGTAKEILQTLYDKCYEINDETGESIGNFVSDDDILRLAKHYGVEVDL